jgi:hypothetical protein
MLAAGFPGLAYFAGVLFHRPNPVQAGLAVRHGNVRLTARRLMVGAHVIRKYEPSSHGYPWKEQLAT